MWYVRACAFAGKYFRWIPGGTSRDREGYTEFIGLNVRKENAEALAKGTALLIAALLLFIGILLAAHGFELLPFLYLALLTPIGTYIYLRKYPKNYALDQRFKAAGSLPEVISNMGLALKVTPNLENALMYSAAKTRGPIGEEVRKLSWRLYLKEHASADDALEKFARDWNGLNNDFSAAVHYLRGSLLEGREDKRVSMIEKGVKVVWEGAAKRMIEYASSLEMPTIALYFIGVLLPLILIALLPTFSYVGVSIGPTGIFLGYCLLLPAIVYLWSKRILEKRPVSFSPPTIPDSHRGFPPQGRLFFLSRALPVSIIPLLGFTVASPGLIELGLSVPLLGNNILILWGVAITLSAYLWATTKYKATLREETIVMEEDFASALHHLENRLAEYRPLEDAIAHVGGLMADKKIGKLFTEIVMMSQTEHIPLHAMLSEREGPLKHVHSDLIRDTLFMVAESSRRSNEAAAAVVSRISAHISNLKRVEEKIKEKLESTVSSMRATMIYFAPFIAGVVVVLQDLMNKQLTKGRMATGLASIDTGSLESYFSVDINRAQGLTGLLHGSAEPISMGLLQLILGFYMLEMITVLTLYIEDIEHGDDVIAKRMALSTNLFTGMIIYTASMVIAKFFLGMVA